MKFTKSLIIFIFIAGNTYSQDILKVGDKAPNINITDYILNAPKDKKIENKFIILEFWATWCAPCLSEVPHLNELQNKFKNRKDLIFLSLTYEKPEKTKRTLEKIKFETVVVSDQTKETESKYNVEGIPHTVLIDNKGIIKWIGTPYDLNSSMIDDLLNGKNILTESKELIVDKKDEKEVKKNEIVDNTDIVVGLLKDKNTQFIFSLINSKESDSGTAMDALSKGKYIDLNNNLKSILSKIIKKPETQIIIPEELKENKYDLLYKNINKIDTESHTMALKSNLLNALNLKEYIENKKIEVYNLKVVNAKKLNISINQNNEIYETRESKNETHFVFSNSKIESLIKALENYHNIIILNETGIKENLDFIIKIGKLDVIMKEIEEYGLILEKVTKDVEFYIFK